MSRCDHWGGKFGLGSASAGIAEYFYQRLAPAVEGGSSGNLDAVQGIGIRLIRDGHIAHHSMQGWDWRYGDSTQRVSRL
jgi:hypothetical protein